MTSVLGEKLREAIEKKSLATTINQWDDEDNTQKIKDIPVIELNKETNATLSASEEAFDIVHKYRRTYTPRFLINMLVDKGHKESSTMQMVYALVRRGVFMRDDEGYLWTNYADYRAAMKDTQPKNKAKQNTQTLSETLAPKRKIVIINKTTGHKLEVGGGAGIAALKQDKTTKPWNADDVVDSLSLTQGRTLYLKLKEIFGG